MAVTGVSNQNANRTSGSGLPPQYQQFEGAIARASQKYGVPPAVLFGILKQESGGKVNITGYDGHGQGPWQIDDRFHGDFLRSHANGRDIESATDYAAKLLKSNIDAFGGDVSKGVSAYNAGVGGVQSALRRGASADSATTGGNYASTIMANAREFQGMIGGAPLSTTAPSPAPAKSGSQPGGQSPGGDSPGGQPQGGSDYTVKAGDTLWDIASRLKAQGAQGSHWDLINQIAKENGIKDPNLILTGQNLKLPGQLGGAPGTAGDNYAGNAGLQPPAEINGGKPVEPGKVPYISQYRPNDPTGSYTNGPSNCGPTSMAMLARSYGWGGNLSDAQLINKLGSVGGTTGDGTGVNGIVAMADAVGKRAQVQQGSDVSWMEAQLRQGKQVVANGNYFAMPPHAQAGRESGHYVAVVGMDGSGNFIVRDPADQRVSTITQEAMRSFLASHHAGGYQIAVG